MFLALTNDEIYWSGFAGVKWTLPLRVSALGDTVAALAVHMLEAEQQARKIAGASLAALASTS